VLVQQLSIVTQVDPRLDPCPLRTFRPHRLAADMVASRSAADVGHRRLRIRSTYQNSRASDAKRLIAAATSRSGG
jgi:hypothetical protein